MAQRIGMDSLDGSSGAPPMFTSLARTERRRHQPTPSLDVSSFFPAAFPAFVERDGRHVLEGRRGETRRVEAFLELLIDENEDGFDRYVLDHAALSSNPQVVATELLGPAARLLGDYWRMDVCDFMKVTVVMGRIQRLFWSLVSMYPPLTIQRGRRTALLAPAPDDQHSFGLIVVEDALRRAGWQVDRCCVDEEEAYFNLLAENDYTVIGLSLSGSTKSPALAAFIRKSRKKSRNASASVLLGGNVFVEAPGLALEAGADLFALDALSAVSVAETAVASIRNS